MARKLILQRDIVIKKGTVFTQAPSRIELDPEHVECTVGLSKGTYGTLIYSVDKETHREWSRFFKPAAIETRKKK